MSVLRKIVCYKLTNFFTQLDSKSVALDIKPLVK